MEQLLFDLIGYPEFSNPKIISIILENFTLAEDHSQFFRAILNTFVHTNSPFEGSCKRLIQIGNLHTDIRRQLIADRWAINHFEDYTPTICDRLEEDLVVSPGRSIIFINDLSRFELCRTGGTGHEKGKDLLGLAFKLKTHMGHFVVVFYQNTLPNASSNMLRDLKYVSDCSISVTNYKYAYHFGICTQLAASVTLMPPLVHRRQFLNKIGRYAWAPEKMFTFYDARELPLDCDWCAEVEPYLTEDWYDRLLQDDQQDDAEDVTPTHGNI